MPRLALPPERLTNPAAPKSRACASAATSGPKSSLLCVVATQVRTNGSGCHFGGAAVASASPSGVGPGIAAVAVTPSRSLKAP